MNNEILGQLSPEDQTVLDVLQASAQSIQVNSHFQSSLEARLKQAHPENNQSEKRGLHIRIIPAIGWALLAIGAFLVLNWALRALVPNRQPAAGNTVVPTIATEQTAIPNAVSAATPVPSGDEYDWRGTKLYLDAALPDAPTQVGLYEAQLDRHATLDSTRALAQQFGMNGQIYETPPELGNSDTIDFLVVDGNQRLRVRSNLYFSYYPDYPHWTSHSTSVQMIDQATAGNLIESFLRSHGFDFDYKVEDSGFHDGYYALPLTPEGLTIHHNHFSAAGFLFRFDQGEILAVEASLMTYSLVDNFEVISAEDALQKLLNPNISAGLIEGGHSVSEPIQTWYRPRPENQTITVWGWINSVKSAEGGAPLVTFDGYQATGNLAGLAEFTPNTFVEASGQFQTVDGNKIFNIESWQTYDGHEDGLQGTIQREGDQVVLNTLDGLRLTLPDIPADLPLPMENAFVGGVTRGDVFEWKSIDTRMQAGGGGGGGGGGSGFYKPNLTGTPVPLPTPQVIQDVNLGMGEYIVQEGDTLSGIAETYGITVDELMQVNGLTDSTIFIGQMLLIPGAQEETSLVGQTLDGLRGMLTVTITNKLDGSQSVDYRLQVEERNQYQLMKLEGDGLDELQTRNNLPIDIWGTVERYDTELGMSIPVVNVERFEIPYPDLQYQIFKGTQSITTARGETITLFTTEDGQTYAQANGYGGLIGHEGDQILMEALVLPDETIAGYPVLQIVSASMAINPKSGEPVEMQATANQPYVIDESEQRPIPTNPTASIESIELVYFTPDSRYTIPDPSAGPTYLQPVWRFSGQYNNGDEFEILVQALKEEFLLPEIETIEPPG
jgi:murein DD-endopeptidase MepM/ murein hydrolase activator NlpD